MVLVGSVLEKASVVKKPEGSSFDVRIFIDTAVAKLV